MSFAELIQPLLDHRDLADDQARALMAYLTSGEANEAQIGGVLLLFRLKGCTPHELAAFALAVRERAQQVTHDFEDLVDTCGTGGGCPSFNISTGAAIVAAAAGARIAKHGNRGVTSPCGSIDVLEQLGVAITSDPAKLVSQLEHHRLAFLFAQAHHPALRHVGKARRDLGVRSFFNQLGPLANPAGAKRQLIGVYEPAMMTGMAEALRMLGAERAMLVHGRDGLDEVSPVAPTDALILWDGEIRPRELSPADFGLSPIEVAAIQPGATPSENAAILREALTDIDSPRAAALIPSAGAAIWLAGLEDDLLAAASRAAEAIASGRARAKLQEVIDAK